jgi:pimeloyl-ACP methyl ester carboxylesterase
MPRPAHEYGALVLAHSHPEDFFGPDDLPVASRALRLWLREEKEAALAEARQLSGPGRTRFQALLHDRPSLRAQLLECVERHRGEMGPASPHGRLAGLRAPVFLLHGSGDSVIPPTEADWLAHDLPPGALQAELITPLLEHVSLQGEPPWRERWRAVHFLAQVLEAEP